MLFCGKCGHKLSDEDIFCGECGTRIESIKKVSGESFPHSSVNIPTHTTKTEIQSTDSVTKKQFQIQITQKTKKIFVIVLIIGLVLLGCYYGARAILLGPSTPTELKGEFIQALNNKDSAAIGKLIDPDDKQIHDPKVLELFAKSLSTEVIQRYSNEIEEITRNKEAKLASVKGEKNVEAILAELFSGSSDHSTLDIIRKDSWLGSSWYVDIPAVLVKVKEVPNDKIKVNVGELSTESNELGVLIPSTYEYKAIISNDYANETFSGQLDLFSQSHIDNGVYTHEIDVNESMKTRLTLTSFQLDSQVTDLTVMVNDKKVSLDNGEFSISPAPEKAKIKVTGKYMGKDISGEYDVNTTQEQQVDVGGIVAESISKINEAKVAAEEKAAADAAAKEEINAGITTLMTGYGTASMDALRQNNFSIVEPYLVPNSKQYKEQKNYQEYLIQKNISEEMSNYKINNITKIDDTSYKVSTYEEYNITYGDGSVRQKGFNADYIVKIVNGNMGISDMTSNKEVLNKKLN
jgi:uncharacterized membrane protein YvbJ